MAQQSKGGFGVANPIPYSQNRKWKAWYYA
jgi:hypothetical protein